MHSICIVVDLRVTVNNLKPFSIANETPLLFPLGLSPTHKTFCNAVDSNKLLRSSSTVPDILNKFGVSRRSFVKAPISNFTKIHQLGTALILGVQT
jgi:hypothetical protein